MKTNTKQFVMKSEISPRHFGKNCEFCDPPQLLDGKVFCGNIRSGMHESQRDAESLRAY